MWSIFKYSFVDIIRLLVDETNRYAHSEKHNAGFSVSMEEMINFIGLVLSLEILSVYPKVIIGAQIPIFWVLHSLTP